MPFVFLKILMAEKQTYTDLIIGGNPSGIGGAIIHALQTNKERNIATTRTTSGDPPRQFALKFGGADKVFDRQVKGIVDALRGSTLSSIILGGAGKGKEAALAATQSFDAHEVSYPTEKELTSASKNPENEGSKRILKRKEILDSLREVAVNQFLQLLQNLEEEGIVTDQTVKTFLSYQSDFAQAYVMQDAKAHGEKAISSLKNGYAYRAPEIYTDSTSIMPLTSLKIIHDFCEKIDDRRDDLFWKPLIDCLEGVPYFSEYRDAVLCIFEEIDKVSQYEREGLTGKELNDLITGKMKEKGLRLGFLQFFGKTISEALKEQVAYEVKEIVNKNRDMIDALGIDEESILQGGYFTPNNPSYLIPEVSSDNTPEPEDQFRLFTKLDDGIYQMAGTDNQTLCDHMGIAPGIAGEELLISKFKIDDTELSVKYRKPILPYEKVQCIQSDEKYFVVSADNPDIVYIEVSKKKARNSLEPELQNAPQSDAKKLDRSTIKGILPHSNGFLMVDTAINYPDDILEAEFKIGDITANTIDTTKSGNISSPLLSEIASQGIAAAGMSEQFAGKNVMITSIEKKQLDSRAIQDLKAGDTLVTRGKIGKLRGNTIATFGKVKAEVYKKDGDNFVPLFVANISCTII